MDASDAAALLAPSRAWLRALTFSSCELKNPARSEHGVVLSFDASVSPVEDAAVGQLREAVDLAYRALAVHTAVALHLREEEAQGSAASATRGVDDVSVQRQLARDAPFELKLTVTIRQLMDAALLKRKIADELVTHLSQTESSDPAYLAAKAQLDAVLDETKPGWRDALVRRPIAVSFVIKDAARKSMTAAQAKVFFEHLTAFMSVLNLYEVPQVGSQGHFPMTFELAVFELFPVPITPEVALALMPMLSMERARIKSTQVTIDPRLIFCSRKVLDVFFHALHATAVELLPRRFGFERIEPMDNEVEAMTFIPMLLASICDCQAVESLGCGVLFALFTDPVSRSEIAKALVHIVLARAQQLNLVLRVGEANMSDSRLLTLHAQEWRCKNPLAKLRLRCLDVDMLDVNGELAKAFVGVLDEVEEISIRSHPDAARISSHQVVDILGKFTTLRKLTLVHVDLETMRVFSTKAPPTFESLLLCAVRLDDRSSLLEFLQELGMPQRRLSKSLRELTICDFALDPVKFRFDKREVESLTNTMRSNRVLEHVIFMVEVDNMIEYREQQRTLRFAAGSVVPARPRVRHTCEEKARRVAFLSVLHAKRLTKSVLDTFVVRQIFEFSDPCVSRFIAPMWFR